MDRDLIEARLAAVIPTLNLCPGVAIVHNVQTDTVEYMTDSGLRALGINRDELQTLGSAYHARFFNPEDAQEYVPKVFELIGRNDPDQSVFFFQQVRTGADGRYEWYSSAVRLLLRDPHGQPLLVLTLTHRVDPTSAVTLKVQRLLEEHNFMRQNLARFALLTPREREVLRLLALGHSAPQIARELNISAQTAETHRRNLRQKLGAESVFELSQYARAFDLI